MRNPEEFLVKSDMHRIGYRYDGRGLTLLRSMMTTIEQHYQTEINALPNSFQDLL